jgi:ABC-2 type transport system ATP-binding protein
VGRPTAEVIPSDTADRERAATILARFGDPCASTKGVAVRLRTDETDLAELVRALDAEGLKVENLQLHQPTLDDVFLAKTGRSLEGSDQEEEPAPGEVAVEAA